MKKAIHPYHHRTELVALGLSPDGRHLATGSFVGEDYDAGGDLLIWEIATGRVVNHLGPVQGGVGWPDHAETIQWSPDGKWLAIAANTNGVQIFKPFAFGGGLPYDEIYPTDGWSRPPSFCWSPDSRQLFVSCWRSSYDPHTGQQVVLPVEPDVPGCIATVGELGDSVQWMVPGASPGAWRAAIDEGTEPRIEPPHDLRWGRTHVLLAGAHGQLLSIDPKTRLLQWLETSFTEAIDPLGELVACAEGDRVVLRGAADGARLSWSAMPGAHAAELFWNDTGTRLAVIEGVEDDDDTPRMIRLYAIDRAAQRCESLGRLEVGPKARGRWAGDFHNFAWGPDGRAIAFRDDEERLQVWMVEPALRQLATQELDDTRGIFWSPSRRLIAWSAMAIHFIDVGEKALTVETRGLLDMPTDDGPFASEALKPFQPAQFPVGPKGGRVWAALLDSTLIVPAGFEADAEAVVGWSDGQISEPLSTQPIARFASFEQAARAPNALPLAVVEALGAGAPRRSKTWGPSEEPRELFDLYALLEVDAAEAESARARSWHYLSLAQLYHRAKKDLEALRSLDRSEEWHDQARARLTFALHSAVRGELDRARLYRRSADDALLARAAQKTPSLIPQIDALMGAVDTLLGGDGRALIDRAAAQIEPENNRGEKRALVARAYAAIGQVDLALSHVKDLSERALPMIADAVFLGLPAYSKIAKACANTESGVMDGVIEGFLALKAFDEAEAALKWFPGQSTNHARQQIRDAQKPPPPLPAAPDLKKREAALANLEVEQHWKVETVAAGLAAGGDYDGAFAVLQRLPKAKRSYGIPGSAIAIARRLAVAPDPRGMAALYSLLEALPSNNLGSNGRAFETGKVLRIIERWPRSEHEARFS